MDFDVLDKQMRYFEQSLDRVMLKGIFLVARLDGHGFTKLTKKQLDLEKPFDVRFRDMMIGTLKHLMDCGFRLVYGYTQSDEISILFHFDENTFAEKSESYCQSWLEKHQPHSHCWQSVRPCLIVAWFRFPRLMMSSITSDGDKKMPTEML